MRELTIDDAEFKNHIATTKTKFSGPKHGEMGKEWSVIWHISSRISIQFFPVHCQAI